MNTPETPPTERDTNDSSDPHDPRGRRWFAAAAAAAAAGGMGLVAGGALAADDPASGPGRWAGRRGPMDPEALARRLDYRIGYLVKEIGGTVEQKDRLVAIAKATLADLKPLREQHLAARQRGLDLLGSATIDKAALEQLRVSQIQAADATSQRVVKALIDAAELFSPTQRAQLAERMKQRMARRHRGMPG